MTAFNAEINVMGMSLSVPEDEEAAKAGLRVNLTIGQVLPLDSGDGNPLQVPFGQISFSLNKEAAEKMGERLVEESQKLPSESKLSVASASDLANIQKTADAVSSMKVSNG